MKQDGNKAAYVAAKAAYKAEKREERREKLSAALQAAFGFFNIETTYDLRVKLLAALAVIAAIIMFVAIDDPEYRGGCLIVAGICAATLRARLD